MSSEFVSIPSPPRAWNHNFQFHQWILKNTPSACEQALEVGCGDGILTSKLALVAKHVTAIDVSPAMVDLARRNASADNVTFVEGDLLTAELPLESFDLIAAVAVLHHMPFATALLRISALLRSGGILAVVGLARNGSLADYAISAASVPVSRLFKVRNGWWNSPALRIDPDMTYAEIKSASKAILPDVSVRRRLFFRYTMLWRKS